MNNNRCSEFVSRSSSRSSSFGAGFRDLNVYQTLTEGLELVHRDIIPFLPETEKYGLADQLRRSSKAPIALLAEGYAKRKHHKSWIKYLEDCIGECNETIAHLDIASRCYDKSVSADKLKITFDLYDKACRQLHNLGKAWTENQPETEHANPRTPSRLSKNE